AGGEVLGRAVAQLGGELAVVQRVAGVVTLAVLDVPDHVPALSARLQQQPGQLLVGQLPAAADVVDLARPPAQPHQLDARHMVVDVQPVAHVPARPVQRHGKPVEQIRDEKRDQFLRIMVVAVVVGTPGHPHIEPVRTVERQREQVGGGLGGRIGGIRAQRLRFPPGALVDRPVHLVRGDVHESPDALADGGVQQRERARDIGADERARRRDRPVDVRLGGEVHDLVVLGREVAHQLRVADVALDEGEPRIAGDLVQVGRVARVGEGVQHRHLPGSVAGQQRAHAMGADESGAPGYQNSHDALLFRLILSAVRGGSEGVVNEMAGAVERLARIGRIRGCRRTRAGPGWPVTRANARGFPVKGIILAVGHGTRVYPVTLAISKQLLPINDKPLIYYPLSVLMLAGIREILVISSPADLPNLQRLLGDGAHLGLDITYARQDEPVGLADAFILGADHVGNDPVALVLGDNVFHGNAFYDILQSNVADVDGCVLFGYPVSDPHRYGVAETDASGRIVSLEEKPAKPRSDRAIVGLYLYDKDVVDIAKNLTPSPRGELEITDVNRVYLERGKARLVDLGRGFAWMDAGTPESMLQASQYVQTLEKRQGVRIACV